MPWSGVDRLPTAVIEPSDDEVPRRRHARRRAGRPGRAERRHQKPRKAGRRDHRSGQAGGARLSLTEDENTGRGVLDDQPRRRPDRRIHPALKSASGSDPRVRSSSTMTGRRRWDDRCQNPQSHARPPGPGQRHCCPVPRRDHHPLEDPGRRVYNYDGLMSPPLFSPQRARVCRRLPIWWRGPNRTWSEPSDTSGPARAWHAPRACPAGGDSTSAPTNSTSVHLWLIA